MIPCQPAAGSATAHVAVPELTGCALQPVIAVPASSNETVPVAAAALTVAVYVTACPMVEGSNEDETVVVVVFLLTV